jgi:hypothetical protein
MNEDVDLKSTTKIIRDGRDEFVVVRPGIVATYYLCDPLVQLGPRIADTIQRYVEFVGKEALAAFLAENGTYKPLTEKRFQRDYGLLRNLPDKAELRWIYSSNRDGGVGDFKIHLFASDQDEDFPSFASLLRLEFPVDCMERYGVEEFVDFIAKQAQRLRAQSGNAGWAFKRAEAFASEATKAINAMLPRYLAFDPCFDLACLEMRGHSPWAHWINFLDTELFQKCGGIDRFQAEAPAATLQPIDGGMMVRASRLPPVGDANRGAKDLGSIPQIARFLRTILVPLNGLGDNRFDARAWLNRFDGHLAMPRNN